MNDLVKTLENAGIHTVIRQNNQGIIYGITYVDHQTKCVFNGSALGKQYSAKGILERLEQAPIASSNKMNVHKPITEKSFASEPISNLSSTEKSTGGYDVVEALLKKESTYDYMPNQLTGKGRKKKRKRNSRNL